MKTYRDCKSLTPKCLLLALSILALPTIAQANPIDVELKKRAPAILQYCQEQGWKNIGVLKFRVHVGEQQGQWDAGQLNSVMANRLENVLILFNDIVFDPEERLLGITRNAGEQAVKEFGKIDYLSEAGRKKLLTGTYSLAWGKSKVKVDAFLTGSVNISKDFRKTTVKLELFDAKNADLRTLPLPKGHAIFTVPTDRVTLADMNRPFYIKSREALDSLFIGNLGSEKFKNLVSVDDKEFIHDHVEFKLYYDDKLIPVKSTEEGLQVPTPKEGQNIRMSLTAKKEPMAVVLLVNGVNTFGKESLRESDRFSRWILRKVGTPYDIKGFYPTVKTVEEFKVYSEKEADYYPLADNTKLGKIELYVFLQSPKEVPQSDLVTSFRSETLSSKTYMDAKRQQFSVSPPVQQGIILPGAAKEAVGVELTELDNLINSGYIAITYFKSGNANSKQ